MTSKLKRELIRILVSGGLLAAVLIVSKCVSLPGWAVLLLSLIPYAAAGWDVVWKALRGIGRGQLFDEQFLMALATLGAYVVGEYTEAVAVMLFYQVGEWFQRYAVGRSRRSIADLMDICPESAELVTEHGIETVDPDDVPVDSLIEVKPGARIPLDGVVEEGTSQVDTSALTGESVPRTVMCGDTVISGCVNGGGRLLVRTSKEYDDSTVARILELVEESSARKGKTEQFITRFARYYTPIVVFCALALAIVPSLVTDNPMEWIRRACTFLVISCPCALVISVPLTFFGGIGAASRQGILIKGSTYMEQMAKVNTVVFDKTGTLTRGNFVVTELHSAPGVEKETLLETAALAESGSTHPIARSVVQAWGRPMKLNRISHSTEETGRGISTQLDGKPALAGSFAMMQAHGIAADEIETAGTCVCVALDGRYLGCLVIADEVKPDTARAVEALRRAGAERLVMLTGDREPVAAQVAEQVGIREYHAELLPGDKVELVEVLLSEQSKTGRLAFVGDGINDAPVLTRSDVGIAMGAMGSDAAIEAADVVLMDDSLSKLPTAMGLAKRTLTIAWQNIVFALAVKLAVLILGALGYASMWEAVFADVGVAVLAILNAMRTLRIRK